MFNAKFWVGRRCGLLIVITATMLRIFKGEWKDSGALPIRIQWTGVTVLVLAIFIPASSTRYWR